MPARRKLVSWSGATILGASLLVALAEHAPPTAQAQAQAPDEEPAAEGPAPRSFEPPVIGPQGTSRFSLAPSDPVALIDSALSTLEKEATDIAASIHDAEHPPEAVAGWSAISHQAAEKAANRRAEYEAGLTGMYDLGVE